MGRTIEDIDVQDVEKRKNPSKHYVYVIHVTWSDGSVNIIFRRYSRFFDFQNRLMEMYPEEAGAVDPEKRIIPFLPGKKFFGRSHIREVAVKRLGPIADYCKQIVKLPRRISQCKEVMEFFEMDLDDMNPQKGKKASMKAKKISTPKPLEVYLACTDYKKQEKGEVTLRVGMPVEVVEKTETGWWFVNADEEQGWVPSTCLQREDGEKEDTTICFKEGEEEQYLCTEEFKADGPDELSMERGGVVDVLEKNLEGWWRVRYSGQEGYVPATYLMKTESFQVRKKPDKAKGRNMAGPQIVKSLAEVSNLLQTASVEIGDDTYTVPDDEPVEDNGADFEEEEEIYTIHEISRILKENKQGDKETEQINANIRNMKSSSLKRGGSIRPPPRPLLKPKFGEKATAVVKPTISRCDSLSLDYVTIAEFSDAVGDGISFKAGQHVKVLEKTAGGWWYIQIDSSEGWAPATYIEKTTSQTQVPTIPTATSRAPPAPPAKKQKPKSNKGSHEDLTEDEDRKDRMSTMEGLKGALKAKLQPKTKSPPVPPKKDFLDTNDDSEDSREDCKDDNTDSHGFAASFPAPAVKSGDSSPRFSLPHKPVAQKKSLDRNLLHAPPLPPQASKSGLAKSDTPTFTKPLPPTKLKSNVTGTDDQRKMSSIGVSPAESSEEKINVAGLAGALKAKFESKEAKSVPPPTPQKPKVENKPLPPNPTQKPKVDTKPTPPSLTQKPKLDVKPAPPNASKKSMSDGNTKPVLNKVEFPAKKSPVLPGKPRVNKPSSPSAIKPSEVKNDNSVTKPSCLKQEKEGSPKPPWVKDSNEKNSKPFWVKPDTNITSKPLPAQKINSDSNPKPSWVKPDIDKTPKPTWKNDTEPTPKASWVKPDVDKTQKPAWEKDSESNPKPSWVKPDTEISSKPTPAWKKPNPDTTTKPSWLKQDTKSDTHNSNDTNMTGGKVSDLASVLKSKFENRTKAEVDFTSTDNKPFTALKPKPARPSTPPNVPNKSDSPTPHKRGLDPKKYASRPLPPMPAKGAAHDGNEGDEANKSIRPLPTLPSKPKPGVLDAAICEDDNYIQPVGVSEITSAIKAKLEGAHDTKQSTKPLPSVSAKCANNSIDIQNNNSSSEQGLFAIADYDANNEGEISLTIGEQYTLLEKADGWWYISSSFHEGWAPADYLQYSSESNSPPKSCPVQNGCHAKQPVFRTCSDFIAENEGELSVACGEAVTVVEKMDGGWWLVQYNGEEGWLPEAFLEETFS